LYRRDILKIILFLPLYLKANFLKNTVFEDEQSWKILKEVADIIFPSSKYFPSASKLNVVEYLKESVKSGYFKSFDKEIILNGAKILDKRYDILNSKNKQETFKRFISTPKGAFWIDIFTEYLTEGVFCHPIYGGNKDMKAFKSVNFIPGEPQPKVRYANYTRV